MNDNLTSAEAAAISDRAAARAATAARVMSIRSYSRSRILDYVAEHGTIQGVLLAERIRKTRTLATVLFAGAA